MKLMNITAIKMKRTARWLSQIVVVALVAAGGLLGIAGSASAASDYGYPSISYTGVSNPPTSDKPQSKLWFNGGSWWADMWTSGTGWQIYRLDVPTKTWVSTGVTNDTRASTLADTLWDGTHLYIASHVVTVSTDTSPVASVSGQPAKLYRYSYSGGKFSLDSGFPTTITNNSSESMTIDRDTTGAIWATWTQVSGNSTSGFTNTVYVNKSAPDGTSWGSPFVIPVSNPHPAPDDISAVVAFGSNKIGVMWSDQLTGSIRWATRTDGTSTTATSSWKVQDAAKGSNTADDHLNLKTLQSDNTGRVFAAIKTGYNDGSTDKTLPELLLLVFKPGTGSFTKTTIATIGDCVSRPQIVLDTQNGVVHAFHTAPGTGVSGCAFSGVPGAVYEKTAPMDNPVFASGRGTAIIQDGSSDNMNDVTTSKQGVNSTTGLVVLASNDATKRYWFSYRTLDSKTPPKTPIASFTVSPTSGEVPLDVNFTDTSAGSPTEWAWDFGDGGTSTKQNPAYTYDAGGTYTATLTVTNAAGSTSATQEITVDPSATPMRLNDFNGDDNTDVIARDASGELWLYPGTGTGDWSKRIDLGGGWNVMTSIVSAGDFNDDGNADVIARDSSGELWLYRGTGNGDWLKRQSLGGGWNVMSSIVAPGDFNADGTPDLIARDSSGELWLYPNNGAGDWFKRVDLGGGWNVMSSIVAPGDFNADLKVDLVARDTSGELWLYPGNGKNEWFKRESLGGGWNTMNAITAPGDMDGDNWPDIIARDTTGELWLYPNDGAGDWFKRVDLGSGWGQMTAIL
ncbi:FG-GAP-like repeat-containing protein [Arthrobacter sp. SO3]|uniref:FG-GAP-like repeat-containing protein n=1 Tax=Arthrobacter sp. SO3 TaxID=1897057 RepID=UPI001CFF796C|nr:FG-GAP-like repeat-containing protein [Arthrobacter sp. SO3]MCB5292954.1 Protease 1 [Arthrobacter sp. SO3]